MPSNAHVLSRNSTARIGVPSGYASVPAHVPANDVERRRNWHNRVMFSCEMQAVPLPLEYRSALYPRYIKPAIERAMALGMLLVLAPILLVVALLIWLNDRGPVFFRQERTGYLGRRFRLFKFRTMVPNAEALKAELYRHNAHGEGSVDFKMKNDPRITRIGRFLRKTSLDELPNLLNVVRGDMALVGPRPTSFGVHTYGEQHLPRLAVRPGITGLWQVSGRADVDFDTRAQLDISYIRMQSLALDIALMRRTVGAVLSANGAH